MVKPLNAVVGLLATVGFVSRVFCSEDASNGFGSQLNWRSPKELKVEFGDAPRVGIGLMRDRGSPVVEAFAETFFLPACVSFPLDKLWVLILFLMSRDSIGRATKSPSCTSSTSLGVGPAML